MSIRERLAMFVMFAGLAGCGLERPKDPPPFDCAAIDRAAERYPERCGDAGTEIDAAEVDAAEPDTGL
jgi:hypothetical protein